MKRVLSAGRNLKGGLRSVLEGLEGFESPCAKVLSVSGFLALLAPFPGWEEFILKRKRPPFSPGKASLLQPRGKKCYTGLSTRPCSGQCVPGMYTEWWEAPYLWYTGRHIPGIYTT